MINIENTKLKEFGKVIKKLTDIKAENPELDTKEALKQAFIEVKGE